VFVLYFTIACFVMPPVGIHLYEEGSQ
jgi:hypothetical protein